MAENLTQMEIHNGASTSFWFDVWDVWYPLGKLINLTGLRGCIDLGLHIQVTGICSAVLSLQKKQRRASNYDWKGANDTETESALSATGCETMERCRFQHKIDFAAD